MSKFAKLYLFAIILLGAGSTSTLTNWQSSDPVRFGALLVVAMLASGLKIQLPGVTGTLSMNFLFILVGIVELSAPEVMALGLLSFLCQYLWRKKKPPTAIQLGFNLAVSAISIQCATLTFAYLYNRKNHFEFALCIAAAATVYFVSNTIPIAGIISLTENKRLFQIWRDCYFWAFPYYIAGGAVAFCIRLASAAAGWQSSMLVLPVVYFLYWSYQQYLKRLRAEMELAESRRKQAEEVSALHLRTIEALAMAIEAKDQTSNQHLERVQILAAELGRELGLSPSEMDALRAASLLHDVGKLAVPEHIISKPGRLTEEELAKVRIHPVVGAEILERVRFPYPVVPIVRHHHERWDGKGYPDGLAGEAIPIGARILAVVDCLDALATERQYRPALPPNEVIAELRRQAGKQLDPNIVRLLDKHLESMTAKANRPGQSQQRPLSDVISPDTAGGKPHGHDFMTTIGAARQEAQVIFELLQTIGSSLSLDETLQAVRESLSKLIPYDTIVIWKKAGDHVEPVLSAGLDGPLFAKVRIPIGQGLSGWVLETRRSVLNGNPEVEPGYANNPSRLSTLRAALAVPLEGPTGLVGVLSLYHTNSDVYTRDHLRILLAIAAKVGATMENSNRFQEAASHAQVDYLTGLPNARALADHLKGIIPECLTSGERLLMLVGDLNGFKGVNDRLGHLEGNRVLQHVARHLERAVRKQDFLARLGGDEFVVITRGLPKENLEQFQENLNRAVIAAGVAATGSPCVSLASGAAWLGEDGMAVEELLVAADKRMYERKAKMKSSRTNADLRQLMVQLREEPSQTNPEDGSIGSLSGAVADAAAKPAPSPHSAGDEAQPAKLPPELPSRPATIPPPANQLQANPPQANQPPANPPPANPGPTSLASHPAAPTHRPAGPPTAPSNLRAAQHPSSESNDGGAVHE